MITRVVGLYETKNDFLADCSFLNRWHLFGKAALALSWYEQQAVCIFREKVYTFAKYKFKLDESQYIPWAADICKSLKDGQWEQVLKRLSPEEKYTNCVNLYHYILEHHNHINYAKPEGFCDEAWKAIYQYAFALAHGAGNDSNANR